MSGEDDVTPAYAAEHGRALLLAIVYTSCAISAVVVLLQLFSGAKEPFVPIVRFGLTVLLAYFVFKGSYGARVLFAFVCAVSALIGLYFAATFLTKMDLEMAAVFTILAGYYTLAAWAPFRSPPIQAYWASLKPGNAGNEQS